MTTPKVTGLTVSEADYDFLSELFTRLAMQAKKDNRTDIYSRLNRFIVRLKQAVHVGQGVPEEHMVKLNHVIQEAFSRGDFAAAQNGLSAMVAAVVRQDPDPGSAIARVIAPSLVGLVQQSAQANHFLLAAGVMKKLHEHFVEERPELVEGGWKESHLRSFDYVVEKIDAFGKELEEGYDPFLPPEED